MWLLFVCYRSWAKVIFLHVSVILLTGGVSGPGGVSNFWGSPIFREGSPIFQGVSNFSGGSPIFRRGGGWLQFFGGSNFFGGVLQIFFFKFFFPKISSGMHQPPPPETVNARPVRILLECILVSISLREHE